MSRREGHEHRSESVQAVWSAVRVREEEEGDLWVYIIVQSFQRLKDKQKEKRRAGIFGVPLLLVC